MEKFSIAAAALPLIIFLYWLIIGYAALSLLRTKRHLIQNILLAPTIGMVMTLLPTFWLSRFGLPVNQFALVETIFLFIVSLLLLFKNKPHFPFRYYLPFALTLMLAFAIVAHPLFLYGFNWISYGNDDMTNYCLSALRFLHYGYTQIPSITALKSHQDMSLYYWFLTVPSMVRAGADLLLAWCSAMTHLTPIKIFMPLIIALHLCLISATGGLICQSTRFRNIALASMVVLTFSALNILGTIYQLIAQVGGLAIFLSLATFLLQPFTQHYRLIALKQSILISMLGMALLIFYPEICAGLVFSMIFYFSVLLFQGWRPHKQFIFTALFSIIICLVALNQYWIDIFSFIHTQVNVAFTSNKNYIFPYFLFPTGLADLWGLEVMAQIPGEPWLSRSIALGGLLLIITLIAAFRQIPKKIPIAIIFIVMFATSLYFFVMHGGFTLFKLAMYMQPFLIGTLVIFIYRLIPKYSLRIIVIGFLCYYSFQSEKAYISFSKGQLGQLYVEVVNASSTHLNDELEKLMNSIPNHTHVVIATPNIVLAKMIALFAKDKYLTFPSKEFFNFKNYHIYKYYFLSHAWEPNAQKKGQNLTTSLLKEEKTGYFYLHDPHKLLQNAQFLIPTIPSLANTELVIGTANRSIFNKSHLSYNDKNFITIPWKKAINLLLYIRSSLGQEYYLGEEKNISLYHLEKDYFYPQNSLVGIGRYLLFTIIHPTNKIRMMLEITNTYKGKDAYSLPPAVIEGMQRKFFPLIGSGSARVFSPIVQPQQIANHPYLMIDLAKSATLHLSDYTGLMNLYGKHIALDNRYIVTYARNISVISDEEYQKMKRPTEVRLPNDLTNPTLEYSGIFEDGWVSDATYVVLAKTPEQHELIIKGMIPLIDDKDFKSTVTVYINDKKIMDKTLILGEFILKIPVNNHVVKNKIELHFTKIQSFNNQDLRSIGAKLNYVGFVV